RTAPLIITPHTGEMARIIWEDVEYVNANRSEAAGNLATDYGIFVVLKGQNTIVADPDGALRINPTGSAGLAKVGSGAALTGMILAFLGTYKAVQPAVSSAVYMHRYGAGCLVKQGQAIESVTASKLIPSISASFSNVIN